MICSNIIGGIGNQMFQYAAGRSLACAHGTELYLDLRDYDEYRLHQGFELNEVFKCNPRVATQSEIYGYFGWRSIKLAKKMLCQPCASHLRGRHYIVEPHFHYWPDFFSLSNNVYLRGYWQSEKYFEQIADVIRSDFEFSSLLMGKNNDIASLMCKTHSVSVHVRRGDYVTNATTNRVHGVCSLEYYLKAIEFISQRIESPVFYFFSDDMPWVRKNLIVKHKCNFIEHNIDAQSFIDMRLMSLCQHHIIANSSFSWWGAWLGKNREKIVIAPERWFRLPSINTQDVCPASWIRL